MHFSIQNPLPSSSLPFVLSSLHIEHALLRDSFSRCHVHLVKITEKVIEVMQRCAQPLHEACCQAGLARQAERVRAAPAPRSRSGTRSPDTRARRRSRRPTAASRPCPSAAARRSPAGRCASPPAQAASFTLHASCSLSSLQEGISCQIRIPLFTGCKMSTILQPDDDVV